MTVLTSEFEYLIHFSQELRELVRHGTIQVSESGIFDIRDGMCKRIELSELHLMVTRINIS